jgi:hypothetical protein
MRWTLLALLGAGLAAVGIVGLVHEIAHGSDIWRRHNLGIALLVPGGYCIWRGLSERVGGEESDGPIWPSVALFAVLIGIAVALYLIETPLAVLFAIVVLPFCFGSRVAGWLSWD